MYAVHVREIGLLKLNCKAQWTAFVILDQNVIFELKRRTMPILPNLQHMVALTNDLALAPTLFTPRMQRLKLLMRAREAALLTRLAAALAVFAPHLRSLELHPSGPWLPEEIKALQPAIFTLLRRLNLKEFVCRWRDALTAEMLHTVVRMPSLGKLCVTMDLETLHAALHSNPLSESRITRFHVTANRVTRALIPKIIALLNGTNMEAFAIVGTSPDQPSDLEDVTSTLGKHCSPVWLSELEIQDDNRTLSVATFAAMRPLLPFCSLQYVVVTSHLLCLSDTDAKTLSQSWPLLEVLMLSMSSRSSPTIYGTLTLQGVLYFAQYCKNLKALAVDFSCTGTVTGAETQTDTETEGAADIIPSESDAATAANRNTWYLAVGKSTISEARPVAAVLRALFPQLVLMTWAGTPGLLSENVNHWLEVERIIRNEDSPTEAA